MNNSVSNLTNISVVTPIKSNSEIGISARPVKFITLPDGILDAKLLERVGAIVQQENCIGCDGRGLADAIAKKLPYGCSYKDRRRMPPANKFAVPDDRSTPGTIDVRMPPTALFGTNAGCPIVINLFAQWGWALPENITGCHQRHHQTRRERENTGFVTACTRSRRSIHRSNLSHSRTRSVVASPVVTGLHTRP